MGLHCVLTRHSVDVMSSKFEMDEAINAIGFIEFHVEGFAQAPAKNLKPLEAHFHIPEIKPQLNS